MIKEKNHLSLTEGLYQEFIKGYDITTPILYNPLLEDLQVLPTVMYYSEDKNIEWFFNEEVKEKRGGYKKRILHLDTTAEYKFIDTAKKIGINSFCRIDARVKCNSADEWDGLCSGPIPADKIYFIEINPMPTLKHNINIHNSLDAIDEENSFYECYNEYKEFISEPCHTGFLLLCSMLANLKPSIKEKGI